MKSRRTLLKLKCLLAQNKWVFTAAFVFAAVSSLAAVFSTYFLGGAIDILLGENNVDFVALNKAIIALVVAFLVSAVFNWLVAICSSKMANKVAASLRTELFAKLNRLPVSYFDNSRLGDVVSVFANDIENISDAISLTAKSVFPGIVLIVSALVVMLNINASITLVVILTTPACFIIAYLVAKFSQDTFRRQQEVIGEVSAFVCESVGNQKQVIALGFEDEAVSIFESINIKLHDVGKKAHYASSIINPITRFTQHLAYTLVGVVGGFIAIGTAASAGLVASFLIYSSQFSKPINEISGIMGTVQAAFASLDRVSEVLSQQEEIPDAPNAKSVNTALGIIEFKNINFSYKNNTKLIKNLNLRVKAGSLVAIVGPTGAGKSTLVNLLMRFYELDSGEITLDGTNITNIKRDSLRESFGMVLQETWLFNGTIKENIIFGRPSASNEEIIAATKKAYAHTFISKLTNGYNTDISSGETLSEGEKQLITIARVMLVNPAMLILDEATSSIDTLTEQRVQRAFSKLVSSKTSFVVAHRLSTIVSADLILCMDKGAIVEKGTHQELIAKNGFYAEIFRSQFERVNAD